MNRWLESLNLDKLEKISLYLDVAKRLTRLAIVLTLLWTAVSFTFVLSGIIFYAASMVEFTTLVWIIGFSIKGILLSAALVLLLRYAIVLIRKANSKVDSYIDSYDIDPKLVNIQMYTNNKNMKIIIK